MNSQMRTARDIVKKVPERPGYSFVNTASLSEGPASEKFSIGVHNRRRFLLVLSSITGNSGSASMYCFETPFDRSDPKKGQTLEGVLSSEGDMKRVITIFFEAEVKFVPLRTALEHIPTGRAPNVLHFLPEEKVPTGEVYVWMHQGNRMLDYTSATEPAK